MIDGTKEMEQFDTESRRWLDECYRKSNESLRIQKYHNIGIKVYPIKTDKGTEYGAEFIEGYPGCVGGGDTIQEAVNMLYDAKVSWESAKNDSLEK